jgi:AraC family transcriptional regulator of adaptative response/methylated-DNA-[protein]-cysteine methyltransferase
MFSTDYQRIEHAINYLGESFRQQPDLRKIARRVHLSEYHFQRLFRRWAGISPKRFVQFLTIEHAKKLLDESTDLLRVTFDSGLSSPGRLHDLFVNTEAVTPGEFKQQGAGLKIAYGFHLTPFGECLLAITDRGICGLSFIPSVKRAQGLKQLQRKWARAEFVEDSSRTQPFIDRIFNSTKKKKAPPLNLFLQGTNFQIKVWEALLKIPSGYVLSYEELAAFLGKPGAARAVGNAIAQNPIGYVIPCHRVIRKIGNIGDYRWGSARKKAILAWEAAKRSA